MKVKGLMCIALHTLYIAKPKLKLKSLQFLHSGEDAYPVIPCSVNQHTIIALPNFYTHQNDILPLQWYQMIFVFMIFMIFFLHVT